MVIMKAFDNVKWDYLKAILTHMNILEKVRHWIFLYVSIASFSINLNGTPTVNFNAT